MNVDLKANAVLQISIDEVEAFKILCKTLYMDFALDEDAEYFVKKNEYGESCVYTKGRKIDDRGDLFVALRNVAVNMIPNLSFRSADYIYKNKI